MADVHVNLQDEFLNNIRKEKKSVSIHVINGYQLNHINIISFDNYVILTQDSGGVQKLVYKHAISTITIEQSNNTNEEKA